MNGYWIQGGTPTFYFQPLYRWIAGALHVVFGDSSVGETYWDAACLLAAALMCFVMVKRISGFRWGVAAASLTLATFTMTSIWYLIGRGLSEISGVGWMSLTAICIMRARHGGAGAALLAATFAVIMFYTRLNHLLLAGFLLALLLPARVQARWRAVWAAVQRLPKVPAVVYTAAVGAGVLLFAAHTWWYAGHFSLLYGTSFGVQQTGLRLTTIGSPVVWANITEALEGQLWMREPPVMDLRAALVFAGALLAFLAVFQVPYADPSPGGAGDCHGRLDRRLVLRAHARIPGSDVGARRAVRGRHDDLCRLAAAPAVDRTEDAGTRRRADPRDVSRNSRS